MSSGSRGALVVLLVLGLGVLGLGVVAAAPGTAQDAPQVDGDGGSPATNSTMLIDLDADGHAHWTVSFAFDLETEHERDEFREMASEFEDGEIEQLGLEAFRTARARASQATGRPMEFRNVDMRSSPDSRISNGTGRLQLEFTWTNFAVRDNDTLQMGDVFNTSDGTGNADADTWMPTLGPNQRLLISPPSGGGVIDANVPARNDGTLVWEGQRNLDSDLLAATFRVRESPGGFPFLWVMALTPILAAAAVLVYVAARSRRQLPGPADVVLPDRGSEDRDAVDASGTTEDDGTAAAEPASATSTDDVDVELLSDEERVERLLERNGGRMKQANIVTETGWSNAKVSQLLSAMEEDGQIDKLRIGRENLISFPDEDIAGDE